MYCGPTYTKVDRFSTHLLLEIRTLKEILTCRKCKKRCIRVSVKSERFCLPWYDYRNPILKAISPYSRTELCEIEFRRIFGGTNKLTPFFSGQFPKQRLLHFKKLVWSLSGTWRKKVGLSCNCRIASAVPHAPRFAEHSFILYKRRAL